MKNLTAEGEEIARLIHHSVLTRLVHTLRGKPTLAPRRPECAALQ